MGINAIDRRSFLLMTAGALAFGGERRAFANPLSSDFGLAKSAYIDDLLRIRALEAQGLAPTGIARFGLGVEQIPYAYQLQNELIARMSTVSNPLVGWKIGWSTVSGRKPLGIAEPGYGPLFADGEVKGVSISTASFAGLLVEQELVLVIDRDISQNLSAPELLQGIRSVHIGFELPSKRFTGVPGSLTGPTAADMIIDGLASHSFKIGPALRHEVLEKPSLEMVMTRDGATIAQGTTAMLDDGKGGVGPVEALRWLIGKLVIRRNQQDPTSNSPVLRAGQIVYTGAVPGPLAFQANGQTSAHYVSAVASEQTQLTVNVSKV
jgi:2-keto-4-pentenoate hydratase